jgi:hypothetical protein
MSISKCPQESLQSFPLDVGFALTETTYKRAQKTPLNLTFEWGTRTTAPNFLYAGSGEIDHVQNDYGTELKYNGSLFTLSSVQITAPSHNQWLNPSTLEVTKMDNVEDFILTFERDLYDKGTEDDPKIIILVNPLLRTTSQNGNPPYLVNMANQTSSPITLEMMFPYISSRNYVYYTTCINGITEKDPYKNMLVILNIGGSIVSATLMRTIKDMYNKSWEGDYPSYIPLGKYMMRSNTKTRVTRLIEGFQGVAAVAPGPGGSIPVGSSPTGFKVEKCVRFDPETQLGSDGTIVLDGSRNPTVNFNTINANRASIMSEWRQTGTITLSKAETGFISVLVGVIIVFILFLSFQAIRGYMKSAVLYGITDKFLTYISFGVFSVVPFIAGFVLGMFIIPANCPATGNTAANSTTATGSTTGTGSS